MDLSVFSSMLSVNGPKGTRREGKKFRQYAAALSSKCLTLLYCLFYIFNTFFVFFFWNFLSLSECKGLLWIVEIIPLPKSRVRVGASYSLPNFASDVKNIWSPYRVYPPPSPYHPSSSPVVRRLGLIPLSRYSRRARGALHDDRNDGNIVRCAVEKKPVWQWVDRYYLCVGTVRCACTHVLTAVCRTMGFMMFWNRTVVSEPSSFSAVALFLSDVCSPPKRSSRGRVQFEIYSLVVALRLTFYRHIIYFFFDFGGRVCWFDFNFKCLPSMSKN